MNSYKRETRALSGGILLLLAALAFSSCSRQPAGEEAQKKEGEGKEEASQLVAEVTTALVERADIQSAISMTGTIAALPNQDVKVSSLAPGRITEMKVTEGDQVKQGQLLAKIDDQPALRQIQQAEAAVVQAGANVENARLNRERNEDLLKRGIAARKDVEDARTLFSVNEAAQRQAQAALELQRLQLSRTEVHAPLSGTIVKRFASVGEQVDGTAAQPLFELVNLQEVEFFGNLPAAYLDKVHEGQVLPVTITSLPGKTLTGRVVAISPSVDPTTDVGMVRIRMANPAGLLRLGKFLSAKVAVETHRHALVVPPEAVYRDEDGKTIVFRVAGSKAEAVDVAVGLETPQQVEILSGFKGGETIVRTGGYGLGKQANIKLAAEKPKETDKEKEK
jgi:RND family efflux transporter MFP subunit